MKPLRASRMMLLSLPACIIILNLQASTQALPFASSSFYTSHWIALSDGNRPSESNQDREKERKNMIQTIRSYGLNDSDVLKVMSDVPRHLFVPEEYRKQAYADSPLPIGYGQTISQPFIVAEMTRLLRLESTSRVLEVGTGSGYQAAVLTGFTSHVYTIEIIKPLANSAASRLDRLGYKVENRHGDGYFGWPEKSPFDAIVVTAAAGEIPPPLIEQLAPEGRMVIPVGPVLGTQSLLLIEKDKSGKVRTRALMPVRFVPLTREDGSSR